MKKFYLYPGKVHAANEETEITTLLGSCVAIALHDPTTGVGGLNHYLLPEVLNNDGHSARYGCFAIPQLIEEMVELGANAKNLKAKVYGGGNVIAVGKMGESVGKRNIDLALKTLEQLKIPIVDKNIGGDRGRRIVLNSKTFEVIHALNEGSDRADANEAAGSSESKPSLDLSGRRVLKFQKNVKVLIVDDSAAVRTLFQKIFEKHGLTVVGAAVDPFEAREMIIKTKPDVMTLDIEMPKMTGVQFLEKIMKHMPVPTVMVSSLSAQGDAALRSLELGAIEFIHKPSQFDPAVLSELGETLVEKVRAAASVNLLNKMKSMPAPSVAPPATTTTKGKKGAALKLILAGGNAGSTNSIEAFISTLHLDTPPVVIACSTITTFLGSFIEKLKTKTQITLAIGKDGDNLRLGSVTFIPAGQHGKIVKTSTGYSLKLEKGTPVNSQIPSASVLFNSAAESAGPEAVAVLFGGFGTDGVDGLGPIQDKNGVTVVQLPEEASFPYAPQNAISEGVADNILPAAQIAQFLFDYRSKAVL